MWLETVEIEETARRESLKGHLIDGPRSTTRSVRNWSMKIHLLVFYVTCFGQCYRADEKRNKER